ncbi:MAG: hypothetical protein Q7R79_01510 [bacterium]|nr:hypothetical protein [bacterium]
MFFKKLFIVRTVVSIIVASVLFSQIHVGNALEFSFAFSLQYSYKDKKILSGGVELISGEASPRMYQPEDGYLLKLLSQDGRELYTTRFEIPISSGSGKKEWFDPKTGEQIYFPKPEESLPLGGTVTIILNVPYLAEAQRAEIFEPLGVLVFSILIPNEDELISTFGEREAKRTEKILIESKETNPQSLHQTPQYFPLKKNSNIPVVAGIGGLLIVIYIGAVVLYIRRKRKH